MATQQNDVRYLTPPQWMLHDRNIAALRKRALNILTINIPTF